MLVVAGDDGAGARADEIDARCGIGAVADDVAEADDVVHALGRIREDGAQRLEVAVDVGEDGVTHAAVTTPAAARDARDRGCR